MLEFPFKEKKNLNSSKWRRLKYSAFQFGKVKAVLVGTIILGILIFIEPVEIVKDSGELILFKNFINKFNDETII